MSGQSKKQSENQAKNPAKKLQSAFAEWKKKYLEPARAKAPLRKERFTTSSDIELPDLYLPEEGADNDQWYLDKLGFPGAYPFTRGVQPTMYRSRPWTIRQYAGFGSAAEANRRYHYLLSQGTTGLSVAFDLPTQMGRDSDHRLAQGEVGRVGVAIDTIEDMERLLDGIPLEQVSTSMTINATAHILLALYLVVAKRRQVPWTKLRGTVQNDVLKEYIARGTYIYPPEPALKIVTDIFQFCRDEVPQWNTISISGYHIREAGSTAVQELAFTLADGIAYVEAALSRGLQIDEFAPRLAFFFNCHNNFLEEVAKFRAARRLWAKIIRERFNAKNDRSCMLRFHTQTAGSTLTARQPRVNLIRTTSQALAAVLGGSQSIHTNAYDEALCLPTEESALLAVRTQQVIAHESGLCDLIDPLAGSFAVEQLTDQLQEGAEGLIRRIDELGGMVAAIRAGFPQGEIERAAYEYQRRLETGESVVVGVNAFTDDAADEQQQPQLLKVDPAVERDQLERLAAFRDRREPSQVKAVLEQLKTAAVENRNIMPTICEAVENNVTLGEISDVLRECYGEYRQGS